MDAQYIGQVIILMVVGYHVLSLFLAKKVETAMVAAQLLEDGNEISASDRSDIMLITRIGLLLMPMHILEVMLCLGIIISDLSGFLRVFAGVILVTRWVLLYNSVFHRETMMGYWRQLGIEKLRYATYIVSGLFAAAFSVIGLLMLM